MILLRCCSNQVNCLAIGEKGQLYAATSEGFCEFLPSKGIFRRISIDAPSQDFTSLVISSGCRCGFLPARELSNDTPGEPVQLFNKYDGLTCDQFMPNAGLLASDGRVYFGSTKRFQLLLSLSGKDQPGSSSCSNHLGRTLRSSR